MLISMIMAVANNDVIGNNGDMLWHIPEDLAYFKQKTINKPVIMGRLTWDSLPFKPLSNRFNIVITNNLIKLTDENVVFVNSVNNALNSAFDYCVNNNIDEIFIIGGAKIFALMEKHANCLYLTKIDLDIKGNICYKINDDWNFSHYDKKSSNDNSKYKFNHMVLVK